MHAEAGLIWLVLSVRLPRTPGTRLLRDHLAGRLREAQEAGRIDARVDAVHAADALLALADGLSSHLLQDLHTPDEAPAVLRDHLNHLFGRTAEPLAT